MQQATHGRCADLFLAVVTPECPTPVASDAARSLTALDYGLAVFMTDEPLDAYAWLQVEPPATAATAASTEE